MKRLVCIACLGALLAACSSTPENQNSAPVDERSTAPGAGAVPPTPTWGNIMAEGRQVFSLYPHNIIYPGICLALTILAVNVLGDGLRDTIDPKMAKRV